MVRLILTLSGCHASPTLQSIEARPPGDAPLPLVVMVHGYGDRPESMLELVEACHLPARVVAPRGPELHPSGQGYSWYRITLSADGVERDAAAVDAAADQLAEWIATQGPAEKVVLSGFSQGGILSYTVAVRHPDRIDAAVPVAGAVLPELRAVTAPPGAPPIRALHGRVDPLLSAAEARQGVEALRGRGWDAAITVFDGVAHQIPPEVHRALCAALSDAIAPAPTARAR
ncbi:MAG: alpha/beta fold hydrolase [Myxococcota bacterium]